jgi:tetratricopeptide (TPR) repeat protein
MLIDKETLRKVISERVATLSDARRALKEAERKGLETVIVRQWAIIGACHQFDHEFDKAKQAYSQVLAIMRDLDDLPGAGKALLKLGDIAFHSKNYGESIDFYRKAVSIFVEARLEDELSLALSQLAYASAARGDHETAIDALKKAMKLSGSQSAETQGILTERLALSLTAQGQHQAAIETYEKALKLMDKAGFKRGRSERLRQLAKIHRKAGNEKNADRLMKRAEKLDKMRQGIIW